jgi:hypothetical protein
MREPHWLFVVDRIGGRVRERFPSPLLPILSITIAKAVHKSSRIVYKPTMHLAGAETKVALKMNVKDRAAILMHLNSDIDARMAYFLASHDEYNYYHQLRDGEKLLYRSGQLDDYLPIDM